MRYFSTLSSIFKYELEETKLALIVFGEGAGRDVEHEFNLAVRANYRNVRPGAAQGILHKHLDCVPRGVRNDVRVHSELEGRHDCDISR